MTTDRALEEAIALAHHQRLTGKDGYWTEVVEKLEKLREDIKSASEHGWAKYAQNVLKGQLEPLKVPEEFGVDD